MKRKNAKEILADSFRELARIRSVDKITVRDITDNCGYSQATFYRQFRDKYDLIAWEYSRNVAAIIERVGMDGYEWREALLDVVKYFEQEREYLANLFLHTTGLDSFVRYMIEINDIFMRNCIVQSSGTEMIDEITGMYIHLYCHGTVAMTCEWVLGNYKVSAEELTDVFEKSLPEPLHKYLYQK